MFLVFGLFNSYRSDLLRQELFEIRDRLFDEAVAGQISFDSRAYRATRLVLNGLLRFAHRVSLARFVVALGLLDRRGKDRVPSMLDGSMSASSEADRLLCGRYILEANTAIAKHLMRSPFFLAVLLPVISFGLARVGVSLTAKVLDRMRNRFRDLDRFAYSEGCR